VLAISLLSLPSALDRKHTNIFVRFFKMIFSDPRGIRIKMGNVDDINSFHRFSPFSTFLPHVPYDAAPL
jgi:hypothetical protein